MPANSLSALAGNIFRSCRSKVANSGMLRKEYSSITISQTCARDICKKFSRAPVKFSFRSDNNEWMVEPEMFAAVMPVGAVILTQSLCECKVNMCRIAFMRKDFPVPAVPRTTMRSCVLCNSPNKWSATMSYARRCFPDKESREKGASGGGGRGKLSFVEDNQDSSQSNGTPSHELGQ